MYNRLRFTVYLACSAANETYHIKRTTAKIYAATVMILCMSLPTVEYIYTEYYNGMTEHELNTNLLASSIPFPQHAKK